MEDRLPIIVYTATKNKYDEMETSVKSLFANSKVGKVYFLIEDDDYANPFPETIETINLKDQQIFPSFGPNYNSKWTYMALMKLAIDKIVPQHDSVLYLDTDTVVLGDLTELFEKDIPDKYYYCAVQEVGKTVECVYCRHEPLMAGVHEPFSFKFIKPARYFNSGVLLCNLKKLRKTGKSDEMIRVANSHKSSFPDQDIINALCDGHIRSMSSKYNCGTPTPYCENPVILHTTSCRNEHELQLKTLYSDLKWSTVEKKHSKLYS